MSRYTRRTFLKHSATAGVSALAAGPLGRAALASDKKAGLKYSMCNETFVDWPHEKVCRFVAECGYGGLEIAPFTFNTDVTRITAKERAVIRRDAEKAGIRVVGLHWLLAKTTGLHLTSSDPAIRKATSEYLVALGDLCADLGGHVIVFGSPKQRNLAKGMKPAQGMAHASEVLRGAMPGLKKRGVTLAFEPLAATETNFITTAAEGVALAKRVDHPNCKVLLDCKAMWPEPTPIPQLIRRHHEWLGPFHANDPNLQGPGFGELEFEPILSALGEVGYKGWVSVEVFDYTPGIERLARESIGYMLECLERLAK